MDNEAMDAMRVKNANAVLARVIFRHAWITRRIEEIEHELSIYREYYDSLSSLLSLVEGRSRDSRELDSAKSPLDDGFRFRNAEVEVSRWLRQHSFVDGPVTDMSGKVGFKLPDGNVWVDASAFEEAFGERYDVRALLGHLARQGLIETIRDHEGKLRFRVYRRIGGHRRSFIVFRKGFAGKTHAFALRGVR
jgi:hypothetical protein